MAVKKPVASPASRKAAGPGGQGRRVPQQRERCQTGFELLRQLLDRAGRSEILAPLKGLNTVDDVLRHKPAFVPVLLNSAWELRHEPKFSDLFLNKKTGEVVQARDEPIAPCGRTFAQVMQAHLYGAARLYLDRLECDWATAKARDAERKWKAEQKKKRATLTGRLTAGLKELTGAPPTFSHETYRPEYEGFGLYEALKPHLTEEWQFRLVPQYGRMTTRQAQAFDDLIVFFRTPEELEHALALRAEDVSRARSLARVYTEAFLSISLSGHTRLRPDEDPEEMARRREEGFREERRIFDLLLTRHVQSLDPLKAMGSQADTLLRRLTPVFGEDIWALVRDETALRNAVNCPDFLLPIIGVSCRALPPDVGQMLSHIQDRTLTRDLLELIMERFPRDELERYLADPERKPIWNALPAKFNNNYTYQADAPGDSSTLKNHENLCMVAEGVLTALKQGRSEGLAP